MKVQRVLLMMVLLLLVAGCGEKAATEKTEVVTPAPPPSPLAEFSPRPESYCLTYVSTNSAPGGAYTSEQEFCREKDNFMRNTRVFGAEAQAFCIEGKGLNCMSASCEEDPAICEEEDPFGQLGLDQYDTLLYENMPERQFSGLTAKCFRLDIAEANRQLGENVPETMRFMDFCYHPKYKLLLYYRYAGMSLEVSQLSIPAPKGKLVVPR